MIMAQEQALLKAREQLAELEKLVEDAADDGRRIDSVERELFAGLLQLGLSLLQAFVAREGNGDAGPTIPQDDKTQRRQELDSRRYLSIFGELTIERYVYAQRAKQKEYAPLDARLGLPAGEFSYVLEDWLQKLCVREAFEDSCRSLADWLGVKPSVRATEQMSQSMSAHVDAFQAQQSPPPAEEEGEILVATFDGKGVPMRRPVEERARSGVRRGKGEKANKKKMACVAGVYSIDRYLRTADDVLDEVRRRERRKDRPEPQNKQVWAEMTHIDEGQEYNGRSLVYIGAAAELYKRDPQNQKPIVCVSDGEKALIDEVDEWLPPRTVHVLDIMHVLERLWLTAYCFHKERSREAEDFVDHYLRMLLEGNVGQVIGAFRRMITVQGLTGQKRRVLQKTITYYDNHRNSMRYDEYLAQGYPIGSGVVEGACRHLVKDRMERTGMRWTTNGARAILKLRAVYVNDDWSDFDKYRIEAEQAALYGKAAA